MSQPTALLHLKGKDYQIVLDAIQHWRRNHLIDGQTADSLQQSIQISETDFHKITRFAFIVSLFCLLVAIVVLFTDDWVLRLINQVLNLSDLSKAMALLAVSCLIFYYGQKFKARYPLRVYTVEAVRVFGVVSLAGCITLVCEAAHLTIDRNNVNWALLMVSIIYLSLGFILNSHVVCLSGLLSLSLGISFSVTEGIWEDFIIRNVLIGFFFTISSILGKHLLPKSQSTNLLNSTAKVFGIFVFFTSTLAETLDNKHEFNREIIIWRGILFVSSVLSVWYGIKQQDGAFRGFGLVFFLINLLVSLFDWFYYRLHSAVFFFAVGVIFWIIATKSESWNLVNRLGQ